MSKDINDIKFTTNDKIIVNIIPPIIEELVSREVIGECVICRSYLHLKQLIHTDTTYHTDTT